MPEPISSTSPNQCIQEPEPLACVAPNPPPAATAKPPPPASTSSPAVRQLVATHGETPQAPQCTNEKIALATAATHTAVSLIKVLAAAPTEVTLPVTLGAFVMDAAALGAATAALLNCREDHGSKPPP